MLKRYIDEKNIEDVPRNGIILIDGKDDKGEAVARETAVSNLTKKLEQDILLANRNGYYEYVEEEMPDTADDEYLTFVYRLEEGKIKKVWNIEKVTDYE